MKTVIFISQKVNGFLFNSVLTKPIQFIQCVHRNITDFFLCCSPCGIVTIGSFIMYIRMPLTYFWKYSFQFNLEMSKLNRD